MFKLLNNLKMPLIIASITFIFYTVWALYSLQNKDIHDFIFIGSMFISQSKQSKIINSEQKYAYKFNGTGYDGQFYYYIALDPINARFYIDYPAYRYTRIGYPLLAKFLVLDKKELISYSLLAVNVFSISLGVFLIALWLIKQNFSPWYSLIYGFYPGIYVALQRDTAEPLAYALTALAIYCFYYSRFKILLSGIFFAAALLTRETTIIFPLIYSIFLSVNSRRSKKKNLFLCLKKSFLLFSISILPFFIYKFFLWKWLGSYGLRSTENNIEFIPLKGIFMYWPWDNIRLEQFYSIVFPGLICLGVILIVLRQKKSAELLTFFLNILILIVFLGALPYEDYNATLRITTGIVLATFFCIPIIFRMFKLNKLWFWIISLLWYKIWPSLPSLFPFNNINLLFSYIPILFLFIESIKLLNNQTSKNWK